MSKESAKSWIDKKLTLNNVLLGVLVAMIVVDIYDRSGPIFGTYLLDVVMILVVAGLIYSQDKQDKQHEEFKLTIPQNQPFSLTKAIGEFGHSIGVGLSGKRKDSDSGGTEETRSRPVAETPG